jgi:GDP-L-fucose synthase
MNNFYNLRIYAVFDEKEKDTRFIKSNIQRYINKEPMIVHQNKLMDFIYMKDLVSIIEFYILNEDLPTEIDCIYDQTQSLEAIAKQINQLSNYMVPVDIEIKGLGSPYIGTYNDLPIAFIGLKQGIKNVYNKLK